ncbi:metallopeptidase [Weissella oryzae SG25]|uniref:Metallopeptidase n=1 Tax=Weissella oryzae (strain DSM 25784 / JCM 18191 / LMG 30913 / SG25) TaxID=1329250 RepID=A0A069CVG9_WEIOS|nr:hypothetical protein [Weissella oryzae]GAK31218.1 metallopeptidase [Weissella oryzae SG25]
MKDLEAEQRLARDKARREIEKFTDEFVDYKKKFEAQFNQIQATIQKLGIADDEMVCRESRQQLEWHNERVKAAKKELAKLRNDYEVLLKNQDADLKKQDN